MRTVTALALFLVGLVAGMSAQTPAPAAKAPDVAGKWVMVLELSIGNSNPTLVLKQEGPKITGTYTGYYGDAPVTGTIDDKHQLALQVALTAEGTAVTMYFNGELSQDGQSITKGVVNVEGLGEGTWAAKRAKN
jgi:hypothetical protein